MKTRLVPKSNSFWYRPLSRMGVGLTTKAGKRPAVLLETGMPVLLMAPQVVPLSEEVSGTSACWLANCQTRNSVVEVPSGELGGGAETRTAPAVMIPRLLPEMVGPVRPCVLQS